MSSTPFADFIQPGRQVLAIATLMGAATSFAAPIGSDVRTVDDAPVMEIPVAPLEREERGPAPSPEHVWVPAHWDRENGSHVWVRGVWERPPVEGAAWIAPRWERRGPGFVLVSGHWAEPFVPASVVDEMPGRPEVVVVVSPPPPPRRETIHRRPGSNFVWVRGHWDWTGRGYAWSPGYWTRIPRAGLVWVQPHWIRRGASYGFVGGYWQEPGVGPARPLPPGRRAVSGGPDRPDRDEVIRMAPPPRRAEFRGTRPSARHVWVDGHWAWRGHGYAWTGGRWEIPPRGYSSWTPARWHARDGGFMMVTGSWR